MNLVWIAIYAFFGVASVVGLFVWAGDLYRQSFGFAPVPGVPIYEERWVRLKSNVTVFWMLGHVRVTDKGVGIQVCRLLYRNRQTMAATFTFAAGDTRLIPSVGMRSVGFESVSPREEGRWWMRSQRPGVLQEALQKITQSAS